MKKHRNRTARSGRPFLIWVFIIFLFSAAFSAAEQVEVAVLNNFPPFSFEYQGKLRGFTLDYLDLLSEKSDLEFELVPGTWQDNLNKFKNGEVDCITAISYMEERTSFTRYTEPYYLIPTVVYIRENSFDYQGIEDLYGKKVGIEAGVYYKQYLEDHEEIALYEIEDTDELMRELSLGNLDAVLTNINIGNYIIKEDLLLNVTLAGRIGIPEIRDEDLRIGVRSEEPELRNTLQEAIDQVSPREYKDLQDKWVSFAPEEFDDALPPEQRRVISNYEERHGGIRYCSPGNWEPIDFVDSEGNHRGVIADIFEQISADHDIPFVFERTESFADTVEKLREGTCDLIPSVVGRSQLEGGITRSNPYLELPLVIATRNEELFIRNLGQIGDKRIGVVEKRGYSRQLTAEEPRITTVPVASVAEGLRKTQRGELFGVVDTVPSIARTISSQEMYSIRIAGRLSNTLPVSFAVREDDRELRDIMRTTLTTISQEDKQRIIDQWISLRVQEQVDYSLFWRAALGVAVLLLLVMLWARNVKRYNTLLAEKNEELERLSVVDQMTGLYNRRKLETELAAEVNRSTRYGRACSAVLLDVDHFKSINDRFGHQRGDHVLGEIASVIADNIRATDIAARWGGEEFLILCPETPRAGAESVAEKIRSAIASYDFGLDETITASLGVTAYAGGEDPQSFIKRVDDAVYHAKAAGRNTVTNA